MNAPQLSAWFQANKKPVLTVAAVGAAGLGLMTARRRNATAGGEPRPGLRTAGTAFASGPAIAGTAPYDSGAYDSYNDLQNQITRIYDELEDQRAPVPLPTLDAGVYKVAGGTTVYQVDAEGNRDWLSAAEYGAMGSPTPIAVAADDARWKGTKLVGTDSPKAASYWPGGLTR